MSEQVQDERLLGLEGAVREMIASTERVAVKQDGLTQMVERGLGDIRVITANLEESHKSIEERIKPIELRHETSKKRVDSLKKFVLPILAGTAGIVGTKFGLEFLHALSVLFGGK